MTCTGSRLWPPPSLFLCKLIQKKRHTLSFFVKCGHEKKRAPTEGRPYGYSAVSCHAYKRVSRWAIIGAPLRSEHLWRHDGSIQPAFRDLAKFAAQSVAGHLRNVAHVDSNSRKSPFDIVAAIEPLVAHGAVRFAAGADNIRNAVSSTVARN